MKKKYFLTLILFFVLLCSSNLNYLTAGESNKKTVSIFSDNNNFYGCFDSNLKVIIPAKYLKIEIYKNYIYAIEYFSNSDETIRHVFNRKGKEIFSFEMSYVLAYYNSDEFIYFDNGSETGFYDYMGNIVLKTEKGTFNGSFNCGYVPFSNGKYDCYINLAGKKLTNFFSFPIKLYSSYSFNEGYAVVEYEKNKFSVIDTKGKKVLKNDYSFLGERVKYGKISASENYKEQTPCIGLIDMEDRYVISPHYYEIIQISENVSLCKDNELNWKIYNQKNNSNINMGKKYHFIDSSFDEKIVFYIEFQDNKKFGLMDQYGKIILMPTNNTIKYAHNGYWIVNKDGKNFLFKENVGLLDPKAYLNWSYIENK